MVLLEILSVERLLTNYCILFYCRNPSVTIAPQCRHKLAAESPIHFNISHYNNTPSSSSPMAVPNNLRKYSTGSPACGRWVLDTTNTQNNLRKYSTGPPACGRWVLDTTNNSR